MCLDTAAFLLSGLFGFFPRLRLREERTWTPERKYVSGLTVDLTELSSPTCSEGDIRALSNGT